MIINIDKEFKSLLQPLSKEEYEQLKQNLIADGCREPLVLWGDIIVDGHNRFEICTNNGIPYKTVQKDFPDRQSAMDWIDKNQLGRRNLTPDQMSLIRGRRYNRLKSKPGAHNGSVVLHQNSGGEKGTSGVIAKEHGVYSTTIERDGKFANAVDEFPEVRDKIQKGEKVIKKDVIAAAKAKQEGDEEKAREILAHGTKPQIKIDMPEDTDGKLKVIFEQANIFTKWDKDILALQKEVLDNYEFNPAVACLYKPFFVQAIKRLREEIAVAKPVKICDACGGSGRGCEKCRGLGYLCERTENNGN